MVNNFSVLFLTVAIFTIGGFTITDAYAYLDPGSGALFIQIIIGTLVGVGITLKLYWYKIKEKFTRSSKDDQK